MRPSSDLPDPDDRHVLAAAIRVGAELVVTATLNDFPAEVLARYGIEAKHPDAFVVDLLDAAPALVLAVVIRQAGDLQNPPRTVDDVLAMLEAVGLPATMARLRALRLG